MNNLRRVSVFGGREITKEIYDNTVLLGEKLGNEGYTVFCGGGKGVMEAISKGVKMVDGLVIGILKGTRTARPLCLPGVIVGNLEIIR